MKQSLQLKTSQQLKLTPALQQSLRLLQLTSLELAAEVQAEIEQNPLLDDESSNDLEHDSSQDENDDRSQDQVSASAEERRTDLDFNAEQTHQASEIDTDEVFETRRTTNDDSPLSVSETGFSDNIANVEKTLYEHLYWQVSMTNLSEKDLLIARAILRSLDDDGYLTLDASELVTSFEPSLEIDSDDILAVLSLIKSLDPIGAGARNLPERLNLVLQQEFCEHPAYPLAQQIIGTHLESLAKKNLAKIKSSLSVNDTELVGAINLITSINPRISGNFGNVIENQIVPDVIVKRVNGAWVAAINPVNQHRLKLNKEYQALLDTKLDDSSAEFIRTKLQQAKSFIKGVMSRYDTLQRVAQQILLKQQAFFEHGQLHMTAMTLADVASALELHESTVSRATSGKYLQSPAGVFELKYFFSSGLGSTSEGESVSSNVLRTLIKRLVSQENKRKPLSDSKLQSLLLTQGHKVARRTVAKYRESLNIPASNERKQL